MPGLKAAVRPVMAAAKKRTDQTPSAKNSKHKQTHNAAPKGTALCVFFLYDNEQGFYLPPAVAIGVGMTRLQDCYVQAA
jgi:hypothetical protein